MTRFSDEAVARVETGARLHLGFYRVCRGVGGRVLGGLGVAVDGVGFRLEARVSEGFAASGCQAGRALAVAREAARMLGLPGLWLRLERCIPAHVGLGSTTQLVLAVYSAAAVLKGLGVEDAVRLSGRGRWSGVGVGAFLRGGLVVDTGVSGRGARPAAYAALPAGWRILGVLPAAPWRVAEGPREDKALASSAGSLGQRECLEGYEALLSMVLPGAAEGDFELFTRGLETIDRLSGLMFSREQPGGLYCCREAEAAAEKLAAVGARGVGQSSWGPLVYGWFPSEEDARDALRRLEGSLPRGWRLLLLRPRLRGAVVVLR